MASQMIKLCTPGNESESVAWLESPQEYVPDPHWIGARHDLLSGSHAYDLVDSKLGVNLAWQYASQTLRDKVYGLWSWACTNGSRLRYMDIDDTWYNVLVGPTDYKETAPPGFADGSLRWHLSLRMRER